MTEAITSGVGYIFYRKFLKSDLGGIMLLDNQIDISKELMDFIKESPTAFTLLRIFQQCWRRQDL